MLLAADLVETGLLKIRDIGVKKERTRLTTMTVLLICITHFARVLKKKLHN